MKQLDDFKKKWQDMSGKQRLKYGGIGVGVGLFVILMVTDMISGDSARKIEAKKKSEADVIVSVDNKRDLSAESLSQQLAALERMLQQERISREAQTEVLRKELADARAAAEARGPLTASDTVVEPPTMLDPPVQASDAGVFDQAQMPAPPERTRPQRRFTVSEAPAAPKPAQETASSSVKGGKSGGGMPWMPAASTFRIVSTTGMNALTGEQGSKVPMPMTFRIRSLAELPNNYKANLQDCYLQAWGYGQMSDERVILRTTKISCVNEHGQALEANIKGTIYGEDGKIGIRGRMVSKTGEVVSKMIRVAALQLPAQMLASVAENIDVKTGSSNNSNNGTSVTFNTGNAAKGSAEALGNTVGSVFNRIANIYDKQAEQIFPVIEVNPGRVGTVTLTEGFKLVPAEENNQKGNVIQEAFKND